MSDTKSTGNLFVNDYKDPGSKQPDYTGYLDITRQQIQELVAMGKAGEEVKLKLGGWEYPSKRDANQNRYFIVAEAGGQKEKEERKPKNEWDEADTPF